MDQSRCTIPGKYRTTQFLNDLNSRIPKLTVISGKRALIAAPKAFREFR
jgi:hypothetical protein